MRTVAMSEGPSIAPLASKRFARATLSALLLAGAFVVLAAALVAPARATPALYVTSQLSSGGNNLSPQVLGDRVVWLGTEAGKTRLYTWTPEGGRVVLAETSYWYQNPRVSGERIVWQGFDGTDDEVFTWTPLEGTVQLTDNLLHDQDPAVSGDRIAWAGYNGTYSEIYTWTPAGGTVKLREPGFCPQVSGNRLVWVGFDVTGYAGNAPGNHEIMTWTPDAGTVQLTAGSCADFDPQVSADRVVWVGEVGTAHKVFTWTPGGGVVEVAANAHAESFPQLSGDRIVWAGVGTSDFDIFAWTPDEGLMHIAETGKNYAPQVSGDRMVWSSFRGDVWEIFTWTADGGTVQVSRGGSDYFPQVSADRIVWQRVGPSGGLDQIFTAVPIDPTPSGFTDISTSPYKAAIETMAQAGIITGYGDDRFGPEDPVLRAQLAKMVVLDLGLDPYDHPEEMPFSDVERPTDSPYPDDFVKVAAAHSLMQGYGGGLFGPYDSVTRAQLLTIVVRAAERFTSQPLPTPPGGWSGTLHASDPDHGANISRAEYNGLLLGIDLSGFSTWEPATRGEVAQILFNLREGLTDRTHP